MSKTIEFILSGYGYRYELYDISNANVDYENAEDSDYIYSDNWQEDAELDSEYITGSCLPMVEHLKLEIHGDGIDEEVTFNTIDKYEDVDDIFHEPVWKIFKGVGKENTPIILFTFGQNGKYYFEDLELDDDEKFDINKLHAETLLPIINMEPACLKYLVYEKNDGTKVNMGLDQGDYSENNYDPFVGTWFNIIEPYTDKFSQEHWTKAYFKLFEHDSDYVMNNVECYDTDVVLAIIGSSRCPVKLLQAVYDEGIEDWLEDDTTEEIFEAYKNNPNTPKFLIEEFQKKINPQDESSADPEELEQQVNLGEKKPEQPAQPAETSDDPIESFRNFMASQIDGMKLYKGKSYGIVPIGSGYELGFHARKDHVALMFISKKAKPNKVFEWIQKNGLMGLDVGDGHILTPMPGKRNPNVIRTELKIPINSHDDLFNKDVRNKAVELFNILKDKFGHIS